MVKVSIELLNIENASFQREKKSQEAIIYFNYTKKQFKTIIIFALANFFSWTIYSLQAPFYPKLAESREATATEYGFVLGVFQLVVFIISPIYGSILGSANLRLVFNLGICTAATCTILFGFLDYIENHTIFIALSLVLRILEACGDAAFVTSSFSIIALEFPDAVATTFATLETCSGVGLIVGPTLGGVLYELGGFLLPFLFMGGCLFSVALLTYFLLPTPEMKGEENNNDPDEDKKGIKSGMNSMLRIPSVFLGFFSLFISASSIGFLVATLEPHLRANFHLSPAWAGLIFMIDGGMYAVSAPFWGKLCDNSKEVKIYTLIGALLTLTGFLFIGPVSFIPVPTYMWLTCVGLIIHGLGTGASFVSSFLLAMNESVHNGFADDLSTYGLVSGLYASSYALGYFVGPSIGGVLLDYYGFKLSSLFVLLTQLLVILLTTVMLCKSQKFTPRIVHSSAKDSEKVNLLLNEKLSDRVSVLNAWAEDDHED